MSVDERRLQEAIDAGVYDHRPGKRLAAQAHVDREQANESSGHSEG